MITRCASDILLVNSRKEDGDAPFQHLEFLVRDWDEYEGLDDDELKEKVAETVCL